MADSLIQVLEGLDDCGCDTRPRIGAQVSGVEEVSIGSLPPAAAIASRQNGDARPYGIGLLDDQPLATRIAIFSGLAGAGLLAFAYAMNRSKKKLQREYGLEGAGSRQRKKDRQKARGRKVKPTKWRIVDEDDPSYYLDDPDGPSYKRLKRYVRDQGATTQVRRDYLSPNLWVVQDQYGREINRFDSKAQAQIFAPDAYVVTGKMRRDARGRALSRRR